MLNFFSNIYLVFIFLLLRFADWMVSFWCVSFWIPCRYLYSLVSHHSVVSFAAQELLNFKKSYLLILGVISCAIEDLSLRSCL